MIRQLDLVTDIAQLQHGMQVVDIACGVCGRPFCEGTVVGLAEVEREDGTFGGMAWEVVPYCGPEKDGVHFNGINAAVVATGRIFRVVTKESAAADAGRELERVK